MNSLGSKYGQGKKLWEKQQSPVMTNCWKNILALCEDRHVFNAKKLIVTLNFVPIIKFLL
jgi:hypothetical protein